MSLDRFRTTFTVTATAGQACSDSVDLGVRNLGEILHEFGGRTFNNGLYRVLRANQILAVTRALEAVFPEYRGRIVPFAFDWLGRHFVCDRWRVEGQEPLVLMLEAGAGEAMEIPRSVQDFHNSELIDHSNDALALRFWEQWRRQNLTDLAFTDCVGYKVPLFVGGADVVANLEVIDLDIYLQICGQLRNKTRFLSAGQSIRNILFND